MVALQGEDYGVDTISNDDCEKGVNKFNNDICEVFNYSQGKQYILACLPMFYKQNLKSEVTKCTIFCLRF